MPDITPGGRPSDGDLKSVFFNLYEEKGGETPPAPTPSPAPVDPQPAGADKPNESDISADNDGDDDEYEVVEVDDDYELEDGDEVIDDDLEGDDDSDEDGSEDSKVNKGKAEEGGETSAYLYYDEDEERDIFLKAVDPVTGESSIYLDREAAEQGLANQVAFIGELKKQVAETRQASNAKIAELEKELARFASATSPEAATEILIQAEMPERFRGINPTTLSEEDLRAYKNARLDAEIKVERNVRTQAQQAQDARDADDAAQERADQHIRSRMTDLKFFGLKNVEDQRMIRQKMAEKPEGSDYDYSDIVTSVAKAFGNSVADQMLLTIVGGKSQISDDSKPNEKPKQGKKTAAKPNAKQVEEVKRKVRRKKAKPSNSTVPTPDINAMGARNILKDAFKVQGKQKK